VSTYKITVEYGDGIPRGVEVFPHEYTHLDADMAQHMMEGHLFDLFTQPNTRISRIEIKRT
jgi:hypothetical protein